MSYRTQAVDVISMACNVDSGTALQAVIGLVTKGLLKDEPLEPDVYTDDDRKDYAAGMGVWSSDAGYRVISDGGHIYIESPYESGDFSEVAITPDETDDLVRMLTAASAHARVYAPE